MNSKVKTFGYFAGAAVSAASAVVCGIFGANELKKHKMENDMMQAAADTVVNSLKAQDEVIQEMKNDIVGGE